MCCDRWAALALLPGLILQQASAHQVASQPVASLPVASLPQVLRPADVSVALGQKSQGRFSWEESAKTPADGQWLRAVWLHA